MIDIYFHDNKNNTLNLIKSIELKLKFILSSNYGFIYLNHNY